jgi:hypothetical protein
VRDDLGVDIDPKAFEQVDAEADADADEPGRE